MRIQLLNDIHVEFENSDKDALTLNPEGVDVLVLAGDIFPIKLLHLRKIQNFMAQLKDYKKVLWVFGNHEFYGMTMNQAYWEAQEFLDKKDFHNVKILDDDFVTIEDVNFFGGTMWTKVTNPIDYNRCTAVMNDFRGGIRNNEGRRLSPLDTNHLHAQFLLELEYFLPKAKNKTVVITHHRPTFYGRTMKGGDPYLDTAFCVELQDKFETYNRYGVTDWFFGHTHETTNFLFEDIHFRTNARGYIGWDPRDVMEGFHKDYIVVV